MAANVLMMHFGSQHLANKQFTCTQPTKIQKLMSAHTEKCCVKILSCLTELGVVPSLVEFLGGSSNLASQSPSFNAYSPRYTNNDWNYTPKP